MDYNKKIEKAYDILSSFYYRSRKNKAGTSYFYNENLEMPTTLKLLGDIKGKTVLDLGCGPGIYAKILTEKGAKVKGIDISSRLLEIAEKEAPEAEFKRGNAETLPYKTAEFDIVLSALMMGHLENWDKVLSEVRRVLKKNGLFVFSGYNPITEKLVKEKWFFRKFLQIKDYFNENWKITKWEGEEVSAEGAHHHKTYGTIIKCLIKNGFEILDYEDAKPLKSTEKIFPKEYKKTINAPHFCVWKVRKK